MPPEGSGDGRKGSGDCERWPVPCSACRGRPAGCPGKKQATHGLLRTDHPGFRMLFNGRRIPSAFKNSRWPS
eukprot:12611424-Alexandrium_andersonii.AAC.1